MKTKQLRSLINDIGQWAWFPVSLQIARNVSYKWVLFCTYLTHHNYKQYDYQSGSGIATIEATEAAASVKKC